ncbi:arginine-ornithine antiporter [Halomonas denitrificans]|nr:arginine-ornithine antiporter [Halomonas denitrificans]MBY5968351.1 arginine-ornithine antiporter [Halomonas denitrificans]MBY5984275.1 arginine-ornithine antiporter [Halomonas sp. DP5Y7-2]
METPRHKLGLCALLALVVGSMIGGGIFSLPQNMAASASPGAMLIGWSITAVGMLALVFVFQTLANRKPELDAGIYAYAKAGFGDYLGFSSAWGYWISAWLGNVSYFVLLFSTLGFFFPAFGDGNTPLAVLCASMLLWSVHWLVSRGIQQAAYINIVTTVAKVVPLVMFIVLASIGFRLDVFTLDIWGQANPDLGNVMDQVRNMMLVTVWVFIGVEGASIYSSKARERRDVGRATVLGFLGVLLLLVMVNVLSMGIMSQPELAGLKNPSMALVLSHVVGPWGGYLISAGLAISLLGALLSWTLLCAEILRAASSDGTMPAALSRENVNKVPVKALWLSNGLIQVFLLLTLLSESTYLSLLYLASSMILVPYLWSAAYALMLTLKGEGYEGSPEDRLKDACISGLATLYALWLLYAGGIQYLLLSALLYAPGAILFIWAKRERGEAVFKRYEMIIFMATVGAFALAVAGLYQGWLSL